MTPRLVLLVGLPGSGKSTWVKNLNVNPISTDAIRLQLADDETDQTINNRVFGTVRYLLRHRLELQRPVTYIDATNVTRHDRKPFLKLARQYGADVEAIFFDVPLTICKARNASRARNVPEHALDLMAAKFVPPSIEEGFRRVEVVGYPQQIHLAGSKG